MTGPVQRHLIERAAERLGPASGVAAPATPAPSIGGAGLSGRVARQHADADVPSSPSMSGPPKPPALSLSALQQADLEVGGSRRSRIAEEYMVLSAQLSRARQTLSLSPGRGNLLMVTSTQPGEGKSFTAMNLAASLAQNRHAQTVLVDGDPKRNSMTERLGLSDRPGLFDLVANPAIAAESLILPTAIAGFSVLPIGAIADQHGFAGRAAHVLHRLARRLPDQLLILDAPPCRATSDPSLWSSEVSQIVMVVEAARTQRPDLERALTLLAACPSIVLVLNKTRFDTSPGFGTYGYYGV